MGTRNWTSRAQTPPARRVTDERLRLEREHARAAIGHSSHERRDTDRALSSERSDADRKLTAREDFLAMVSHDLRNLVNVISMKASLALQNLPPSPSTERSRRLIEDIRRSSARVLRWTRDLIDLSALEAGSLPVTPELNNPVEVIEEAVEFVLPLAEAKHIDVSVETPDVTAPARFDAERILEVLQNLLDNSVKHTAEHGRIQINLRGSPKGLAISVADTGRGISEEDLPNVFERYWHGSKRGAPGTGLGLFICKRIVESHGGTLTVDTQCDKGTTFTFTLPCSCPEQRAPTSERR